MKKKKPRIVLFDLETSALEGDAWVPYKATLIDVTKDWTLLSFAYKELGHKNIKVVTREAQSSDKEITGKLWEALIGADLLIAHNGDRFDIRKANAKFLEHFLPPPFNRRNTIDTLKVAKRNFALTSNKLTDIAKLLRVGEKLATGGYELWRAVKRGSPAAWRRLAKYNRHDIILLEKVYLRMQPWDDIGNKKIERLRKLYEAR
jgi:uncharacterized protein YprB with RNaseH-like and TPR domain